MIKINTSQLDRMVNDLKTLGRDFNSNTDLVLKSFVTGIYSHIKFRSPVETGEYRASWDMASRGPGNYVISNNQTKSLVMETGSTPGKPPWPRSTTPLKKGQPGPSRTVDKDGKIWSKQTPEPVATVAVETAPWEKLYFDLYATITGNF